jgi:hypothetical protein
MKMFALSLAASLFAALHPVAAFADAAAVAAKIVVPKVNFADNSLRESLEFLGQRAKALDPDGLGINIIVKAPESTAAPTAPPAPPVPAIVPPIVSPAAPGTPPPTPATPPIPLNSAAHFTLALSNVPLAEVVKYIAKLTDCTLRWDPNAVVVLAPVDGKKLEEKPRPGVPVADGLDLIKIVKPLQETKIPKIDFRETTVGESLAFLSQRAKALLPGGKGLNIVLKADAAKDRHVAFTATNISVIDALRYTAELADLEVSIEEFAVVISDPKAK